MPPVRMAVSLALLLACGACAGPDPARGPAVGDLGLAGDQGPGAAGARPSTLEQLMERVATRQATPAAAVAGYSIEGRPLPLAVLGDGPDTTLLLASIHGDEDAGTPLLAELATHLRARPELLTGRRVVLLPVVNPDGLASGRRGNARHVDLNRNFPASNRREHRRAGEAPLSEPESRALAAVVEHVAPARVVSIHGWIGLVDWDGPAAALARAMGAACQLPAQRIGSRPGSLGSHLGVDQGLPVITLELPADARGADAQELWARFGPALLVAVGWPGES